MSTIVVVSIWWEKVVVVMMVWGGDDGDGDRGSIIKEIVGIKDGSSSGIRLWVFVLIVVVCL